MFTNILTVASLAIGVLAHGDHNQMPIAGPHKALWYNTLPGDGGTQVCLLMEHSSNKSLKLTIGGRFRFLWHLHVWSTSLLPMPCIRWCEVWHCIYWCVWHSYNWNAIKALHICKTLKSSTGAPFDTGTSYRPGARFGPSGIRQGSRRLNL